ncbi:MAG: thioredoxin domain-containing protein [Thermoflexales bacterium]
MLTEEPVLIEEFVRAGKVKLVFRDVLNHGERSLRAHEAASCAGRQQQFWGMHEILFRDQPETLAIDNAGLVALMKKKAAGLPDINQAEFAACVDQRQTLSRIQATDAEQRKRGINTQPIFEIGAQRYYGRRPIAGWREILGAAAK